MSVEILYTHEKPGVAPCFQIKTTIYRNGRKKYVIKSPLQAQARKHIEQTYQNYLLLQK
jgi:hypothetical protein